MRAVLALILMSGVLGVSCTGDDSTGGAVDAVRVSVGDCITQLRADSDPPIDAPAFATILACRRAGLDPVWNEHGVYVTEQDYEAWRRESGITGTISPRLTTTLPQHERLCPGGEVYVEYSVSGGSDLLVTMWAPHGIAQREGVRPGTVGSYCMDPDDFFTVSAQNMAPGRVSLSCSITVDGVNVARNTSSGEYVIAMCSP